MGLKEIILIAMVAVALYGRSGIAKSHQVQTILPWLSPRRRTADHAGRQRSAPASASQNRFRRRPFVLRGNRLFWFLTILAATAVATLIFARAMILGGASNAVAH